MAKNLQPTLNQLHIAFNKMNNTFFKGELEDVVIAIRSQGKRKGVQGWFSVGKVWGNGEQEKHEIVICAETLHKPLIAILTTLMHEMIHLYCSMNGIDDTSRKGAYHNRRFKNVAEDHGFYYVGDSPDPKIGFSNIQFTEETKAIVEGFKINAGAFGLARKTFGTGEKEPKKSNIIKWVCPSCGDIIRSSKPSIKAYCMNDMEKDGETEKEACATFFEPVL